MLMIPRAECLRSWSRAGLCVGCWLLAIGSAAAQFDFLAGSLLDPPVNGSQSLPSVMPQPPEVIPPTPAQPFGAGPSWDAPNGLQLPVTPSDFAYHFGGKGRGYYINDQRIE